MRGVEKVNSKILFSDVDDTLVDPDKTISKENRDAIVKMLEAGHYFVAVTGKPIVVGRNVIKDLGLTMPGCYMAAFNGAVIYDCAADRILMERTLPLEVVREIFDEADKESIYVQTYQNNHILTQEHTEELEFYLQWTKMEYKLVPDIFYCLEKEPNKVVAISVDGMNVLQEFREKLQNKYPHMEKYCNCFISNDEYLEFCPKDVNKGMGVQYMAEFLNIPIENTVAVGDARNDISMIQRANVGVAVKNGMQELKQVADYITEHDYRHGAVAEVIEKFILN